MEHINNHIYEIVAIVGWIVVASMMISYLARRAKRRALELQTAADALTEFYEAVDYISDDPALPTSALEMLHKFTHVISDPQSCSLVTSKSLLSASRRKGEAPLPPWEKEINQLKSSRPELVEAFYRATSSGIIAMFYRWPGNAWKMPTMIRVVSDRRREADFADRVANLGDRSNTRNQLVAA